MPLTLDKDPAKWLGNGSPSPTALLIPFLLLNYPFFHLRDNSNVDSIMSLTSNTTWALNTLSFLTSNSIVESSGLPNITALFVAALATAAVVYTCNRLFHKSQRYPHLQENKVGLAGVRDEGLTKNRDLNKDRQAGEWNPVRFQYPLPIEACPDKLCDVKPIPYRPFKWGPYHVTMGIRSMIWNDWIELDRGHAKYHEIKAHRMKLRGQAAVRVLSDQANPDVVKGGAEAAVELVHELAEYLSRRYPCDFEVVRHSERVCDDDDGSRSFCDWGWEELPAIRTVRMTSLDVSYQIPISVDDGERAAERAMEIAGLMIQDDLALMLEGQITLIRKIGELNESITKGVDGRYYFQAGSICLPGFWRMQDKIGLPLEEIHISGNVPQYKERLQTSLERFFRRLAVDKPVVRNNYFFQTNRAERRGEVDEEELGWAKSTVGPEEAFEHGTAFKTGEKEGKREEETRRSEVDVEWIRLRSERQTLRRLGRSGAVVFTIRTYLTPVGELVKEKGVSGRMASALKSWPADVGEYKGKERGGWYEPLIKYLEERMMDEPDMDGGVGKEEERMERD